jgi:hypothetical protein
MFSFGFLALVVIVGGIVAAIVFAMRQDNADR